MILDYSLLTHTLPTTIRVGGKDVRIDTRTCKALQSFVISEMENLPAEERAEAVVGLLVPESQSFDVEKRAESYRELQKFLSGYPSTAPRKKNAKAILSYEQDHALIVAAFRQAYGVGLAEVKNMHWWEFLALLAGLPDDTRLSGIIEIRGMEFDPKDSPEQRKAKIKAKSAVAIRPKRKAIEEELDGEDIISRALGG